MNSAAGMKLLSGLIKYFLDRSAHPVVTRKLFQEYGYFKIFCVIAALFAILALINHLQSELIVKRLKSFDITARYGNPAVFDTVKKEIWFFKELDSRTCEPYS